MKFHGVQINEGDRITNASVASGTSFPATPDEGELFFRSDSDATVKGLYCYTGGTWAKVASTTAADAAYVNVTGDTMTGQLILTSDSQLLRPRNASTGGQNGLRVEKNDGTRAVELLYNGSTASTAYGVAAEMALINTTSGTGLSLGTSDTSRIVIGSSGGIGIASPTPAAQTLVSLGATNTLSLATQRALFVNFTGTTGGTGTVVGIVSSVNTASATYTVAGAVSITASAVGAGANSTITRAVGLLAPNQTAGVNNASITDATTFTGNWFINQTSTTQSTFGGNVGIGTTSIGGRLHVYNGTTSATPAAVFYSNNDGFTPSSLVGLAVYNNLTSGFLDTNLVYGNSANSYFALGHHNGTSYAERMRIDSAGKVSIGGTVSGNAMLTVTSAATAQAKLISLDNSFSELYFGRSGAQNAGSVSYNHSSDSMAFYTANSERMRIDSSGNLGIGAVGQITVSGARLTVATATTSSTEYATVNLVNTTTATDITNTIRFSNGLSGSPIGYVGIANSAAVNTGIRDSMAIGTQNAKNLVFTTADTARAVIDSTGNFGIGVTPSATWNSSSRVIQVGTYGTLAFLSANSAFETGINFAYNGTNYIASATGYSPRFTMRGQDGAMLWYNTNGSPVTGGASITYTQAMTLDNSGNLGIGIAPSYKLHIAGSLASQDVVRIQNSGGTITGVWGYSSSGHTYLVTQSNHDLVFGTNNVERMRIDTSGNVLFSKTAQGFTGVGAQWQLAGREFGVTNDLAASSGTCFFANRIGGDGNAFQFLRNSSLVGSIAITSSATAYNTTSDERRKENIVDAPSGSAIIDAIKVRQFNFKTEPDHTQIGFIAQELVEHVPDAVHVGGEDAELEPWGVDLSKLVPLMMKELQELRARTAALEAELTALRA